MASSAVASVLDLPSEKLHLLRETFASLVNAEGVLPAADLPLAIRAAGSLVSDAELRRATDALKGADLTYAAYLHVCSNLVGSSKTMEVLLSAFETLDATGRGYMTAAELRGVLSCVSETAELAPGDPPRPLPPDTVDAILAFGDGAGSGTVDYAAFIAKLFEENAKLERERTLPAGGAAGSAKSKAGGKGK